MTLQTPGCPTFHYLKIAEWEIQLHNYEDNEIIEFLKYGFEDAIDHSEDSNIRNTLGQSNSQKM